MTSTRLTEIRPKRQKKMRSMRWRSKTARPKLSLIKSSRYSTLTTVPKLRQRVKKWKSNQKTMRWSKTARPKLSLVKLPRYSMRTTDQKLRQRVLGLRSIQKKPIRNLKVVILAKDKLWLQTGTRLSLRRNRETRLSSPERPIYKLKLSRAAKTRTKEKISKPILTSQ